MGVFFYYFFPFCTTVSMSVLDCRAIADTVHLTFNLANLMYIVNSIRLCYLSVDNYISSKVVCYLSFKQTTLHT